MPSKHADRLGNQRVINDYDIYLRACSNLIYSVGEKMADSGARKAIASFGDNPICKNDVAALKAKFQPGIGRDCVVDILGMQQRDPATCIQEHAIGHRSL